MPEFAVFGRLALDLELSLSLSVASCVFLAQSRTFFLSPSSALLASVWQQERMRKVHETVIDGWGLSHGLCSAARVFLF